jgi:hypothetical protein
MAEDAGTVMNNDLIRDIKFNCDISDAQYWGYFSICGLLIRYRDLYRSEKGLGYSAEIGREDIGAWIQAKEAKWPELEEMPFRDLTLEGKRFDPFDPAGINHLLVPQGLVYGAGYGVYMKPTFFLARLVSIREVDGLTVYTADTELVRDLFTAAGMLQGTSILLRLEPLTMLLMSRFSSLNSRRSAALDDAFAQYAFPDRQIQDRTFEERLKGMALRYAEFILRHECAEAHEQVPEWKNILGAAGDRKAELYVRAVKDLIADTSDHGPYRRMIETRDRGSLSLHLALAEGFPKVLFPEMKAAHARFLQDGDWEPIERARLAGRERFLLRRSRIIEIFHTSTPGDLGRAIRALADEEIRE